MTSEHSPSDNGADDFEHRVARLLKSSEGALTSSVRSRLSAARAAALEEAARSTGARTFRVPGFWLPAAVLSASAMLAVAVWLARPADGSSAALADSRLIEDSEVLAANEEPELFSEDADFFEWAGVTDTSDNRGS